MSIKDYFASLFNGIVSLLKGMQVTGRELVTPKITHQYPENRDSLDIAPDSPAAQAYAAAMDVLNFFNHDLYNP